MQYLTQDEARNIDEELMGEYSFSLDQVRSQPLQIRLQLTQTQVDGDGWIERRFSHREGILCPKYKEGTHRVWTR